MRPRENTRPIWLTRATKTLHGESSHSFNAGVDFELFGSRLSGSAEYFSRKTVDLLYSKDVPLSAGNPTGYYPVNVGSIVNNGFEVTLEGILINTDALQWSLNMNLSHYRNRILALDSSVSEEGIKEETTYIRSEDRCMRHT